MLSTTQWVFVAFVVLGIIAAVIVRVVHKKKAAAPPTAIITAVALGHAPEGISLVAYALANGVKVEELNDLNRISAQLTGSHLSFADTVLAFRAWQTASGTKAKAFF